MDTQQTQYPLFSEHARSGDPATSHTRAGKLDQSLKLSKRVIWVLKTVRDYPGKNARDLGIIMYRHSDNMDASTYPHKSMKKLVDAGFVERKDSEHGLLCTITDEGKKILQNLK